MALPLPSSPHGRAATPMIDGTVDMSGAPALHPPALAAVPSVGRGDVAIGHPGRGTGQHRQATHSTVQHLDLAPVIHRQDQRLLWRIQVQAHDVADLADDLRVAAEHPGPT